MIKFIKNYFEHRDEKGYIKGLINFGRWEEVNIIESEANVIRGNHYHSKTDELFIIIDGKIRIKLQRVENGKIVGDIEEIIVKKNDVFLIERNVFHIFEILEKSRWINLLSSKIDSENPDILRI